MFEAIITFMILSYIFILLLRYWFRSVTSDKTNNCCPCDNKEEKKEKTYHVYDKDNW